MKSELDFEIDTKKGVVDGEFSFDPQYVLDSTFENITFQNLFIENGSFGCSLFKNCNFVDVKFRNLDLYNCDFEECSFENTIFLNCKATGISFKNCKKEPQIKNDL